jgi:cytochrome oxidase assembly protein ShyY1
LLKEAWKQKIPFLVLEPAKTEYRSLLYSDEMGKESWGWIDITSIATASGADLKPTLAFIQPDDGNRDDQTVARVTLPALPFLPTNQLG